MHNKCYWKGNDYIGIGESAHGRLKLDGKHYAFVHPHTCEALTPSERAEELVLVGLRLEEGIDKTHFEETCGYNLEDFINQKRLEELTAEGLLSSTSESLKATDKGFLLIDKLALELLS